MSIHMIPLSIWTKRSIISIFVCIIPLFVLACSLVSPPSPLVTDTNTEAMSPTFDQKTTQPATPTENDPIASPLPSKNPAKTEAPTSKTEEASAQLVPTTSPTLNHETPILHNRLKVAFATIEQVNNSGLQTQIWLLLPPYKAPTLLLNPGPDKSLIDDQISWSNNGNYLAFSQKVDDDLMTISTIDVSTKESQALGITSAYPSEARLAIFPDSWSPDDQWLRITKISGNQGQGGGSFQDILVNLPTNTVFELDEEAVFLSWSPVIPDQFAYIYLQEYPFYENASFNIGVVGQDVPLLTISDFGNYSLGASRMSWSPDGEKIIISAFDVKNSSHALLLIDVSNQTWDVIKPNIGQFPASWSADVNWVALWGDSINFLNPNKPSLPIIQIEGTSLSSIPKRWLSDCINFMYQDGNTLLYVDPSNPAKSVEVVDFNEIGLGSDLMPVSVEVWDPNCQFVD